MSLIQIWDVVEQGDIGCTRGGGSDARAVFSGAGLLYASSARFKTPSRQGSYQFPSEMELFVVLHDVGSQKRCSADVDRCLFLLFFLITIVSLVLLTLSTSLESLHVSVQS